MDQKMGWVLLFILPLYVEVVSADRGLSAPVSINEFGAVPNDNRDDTLAIERALSVNGNITMKEGVYNVHGLTRIGKSTVIDGNNSTFLSQLDTTGNGRASKNILTLQGDRIVIKDLLLDGAYTTGNAKIGENVASLLHIYDSNNILLDSVSSINYASNWWESKTFNFSKLNNDHTMDMYHAIYIGFSRDIKIKNMEQKGNIATEGLLIYESDNIKIDGFKSFNSPKIWTSLHIVASDNIKMNYVEVSDGLVNDKGSSINFIANHHFLIENTKTTTKQGFDISNEIKVKGLRGRIVRDTSYGRFNNCYFKGQRALYGYPSIQKNENLIFKNTVFMPTKEGSETWGVRIQYAGDIRFDSCTFGSKKFKTFGIIMGDSKNIIVENSRFINPSIGIYIFGKKFHKVDIRNSFFKGDNYTPISFYWDSSSSFKARVDHFNFVNNKAEGKLVDDKFYRVAGGIEIRNTSSD